MPPCAGLRAHVELSKISGYIVCETFRIAPQKQESLHPTNTIQKALDMLQQWQSELPETLQMPDDLSNPDPSCYILHMAHNQLIVLTTRPVLFATIKRAIAQRFVSGCSFSEHHTHTRHIQACTQAAHRNLRLAQRIIASDRKLLQAGIHFVFNAAVVLLLKRMLDCAEDIDPADIDNHTRPTMCRQDSYAYDIQTAIRIFEVESRTGTNYPRDCYRVLQDLQALTNRYRTLIYGGRQSQASLSDNLLENTSKIDSNSYHMSYVPDAALSGSGTVYQEKMMAWVQPGGLQLYDSFFM
jgi:hypothetical protein